jgi:flagellar motor protein MotB
MKRSNRTVPVLAVALLAVALAGCRSSRGCCPPQQTACAPSPCAPPCPQPYVMPAPCAPPMAAAPRALPPQGGTGNWGFEDMSGPPMPTPMPAPMPSGSGLSDRLAAEQSARAAAEDRLTALQRKLDQLENNLTQTSATPVSRGGTSAGAAYGAGESSAERLAAELSRSTRGEVEHNGRVVIVRLSDAFLPGSEQMKRDSAVATTIMATAEALLRYPTAEVAVVGHSDGTPISRTKDRWTDNVHLSRERAQTVAQELARHGVPGSRIAVDGRGSVEPLVYPESTAADRARNRRVEIHVRF